MIVKIEDEKKERLQTILLSLKKIAQERATERLKERENSSKPY